MENIETKKNVFFAKFIRAYLKRYSLKGIFELLEENSDLSAHSWRRYFYNEVHITDDNVLLAMKVLNNESAFTSYILFIYENHFSEEILGLLTQIIKLSRDTSIPSISAKLNGIVNEAITNISYLSNNMEIVQREAV